VMSVVGSWKVKGVELKCGVGLCSDDAFGDDVG